MPGKKQRTKTRRTPAQRIANRQGLLNLNSAIGIESDRLNALKRFFNAGQQNPYIAQEEMSARERAAELVRELEEDAQRDEAERLRLEDIYRTAAAAAATSAREAAVARRLQEQGLPVMPAAVNLSSSTRYFGNLPLNNSALSPVVEYRYTGGKTRRRKNKSKSKNSRKHLQR